MSHFLNYYGVIPISSKKCPNTKTKLAVKFVDWLISDYTKGIIDDLRLMNNNYSILLRINDF